ncbi:beta-lactamase family protein [Mytilinidion resinicola]|uniref:Beta-lactamase family protein n=1 Tax=Mytilinidion resinicola TaxID=574789 RepID=A0A6A6YR20_9PEZI|nr:beta-lactamase family protein [Mytilinidion resinicola]KAF2811211.1 beta-lactamase family protein [Mytilinidion resinicola]
MPGSTSSPSTASRLSSLIQNATSNPQHIPGLVVQVVDRHGNTEYSSASGIRGLGVEEPMTTDTVFWVASCTKLFSAIALMKLVEQGQADLDSADLLEDFVHELKDIQILKNGKLRPKANRITLRMLMTHVGIDWPLGMANTSFVPSRELRSKMAILHQRGETLAARPHLYGPAREEMEGVFQSAGAGLLSTAPDYSRVLSMILNGGVSPHTQQRILLQETVHQMFQNQIPDYMTKHVGVAQGVSRHDLVVPPTVEPVPVAGYFGWGLNFELQANPKALNPALCEKEGFPRGSAAGLSNCFWTVDREKGVAAVCMTQILPFGDTYVLPLWQELQEVIFED